MASIGAQPGQMGGPELASADEQSATARGRGPALRRGGLPAACAAGLAASIPVIAATVEGLREGATPTGDRAIILTRSFDVFSSHSPLVGQFSASSLLYSHTIHSLGPLLYWLLALPVRMGEAAPAAVAMAAANALAIAAAVLLARRAGLPAMALAGAALALMCGSLWPETLHDVWNPSAGLLPFTLLLFVCWRMACGEHRLLPLAVLLASFAAQCELVFLAPSVAALALGTAGLLAKRRSRRAAWRWWLAALAVALAAWSAPLADELSGHPGNLTLVAQAAFSHGHTLGPQAGWRALVDAVGLGPWWLAKPHDPFGRLADVRAAPSQLAVLSCIALLAALALTLGVAAWRRRAELAWAAAIALALCFCLYAITASTPSRPSLQQSLGYMLWIGSPIGMWAWLALAWAGAAGAGGLWRGATVVRWLRASAARDHKGMQRTIALAAAVAAPLAAGIAVAGAQGSDQDLPEYRPVKTVQAAVRNALAGQRTVLVTGSHRFTAFDFRAAVIYDLRRRGVRVYAPAASVRLGSWYEPDRRRRYTTVWVFDEPRPPKRGRTIARLRYGSPPKTITVMIAGPQPPARSMARDMRRGKHH